MVPSIVHILSIFEYLPMIPNYPGVIKRTISGNTSRIASILPYNIVSIAIKFFLTPLKTNERPLKINGWFRCIFLYFIRPFKKGTFVIFQGCKSRDLGRMMIWRFERRYPSVGAMSDNCNTAKLPQTASKQFLGVGGVYMDPNKTLPKRPAAMQVFGRLGTTNFLLVDIDSFSRHPIVRWVPSLELVTVEPFQEYV